MPYSQKKQETPVSARSSELEKASKGAVHTPPAYGVGAVDGPLVHLKKKEEADLKKRKPIQRKAKEEDLKKRKPLQRKAKEDDLKKKKPIHRKAQPGGSPLLIDAPDSPLEKEADVVAEQVVQHFSAPGSRNTAQSYTPISRAPAAASSPGALQAPPYMASELDAARGQGQSLPGHLRSEMEGVIGTDLSGVRIHTDAKAAVLSEAVNAQAFTFGQDVYFNAGMYQPGSVEGVRLLGHEMGHVKSVVDNFIEKKAGKDNNPNSKEDQKKLSKQEFLLVIPEFPSIKLPIDNKWIGKKTEIQGLIKKFIHKLMYNTEIEIILKIKKDVEKEVSNVTSLYQFAFDLYEKENSIGFLGASEEDRMVSYLRLFKITFLEFCNSQIPISSESHFSIDEFKSNEEPLTFRLDKANARQVAKLARSLTRYVESLKFNIGFGGQYAGFQGGLQASEGFESIEETGREKKDVYETKGTVSYIFTYRVGEVPCIITFTYMAGERKIIQLLPAIEIDFSEKNNKKFAGEVSIIGFEFKDENRVFAKNILKYETTPIDQFNDYITNLADKLMDTPSVKERILPGK